MVLPESNMPKIQHAHPNGKQCRCMFACPWCTGFSCTGPKGFVRHMLLHVLDKTNWTCTRCGIYKDTHHKSEFFIARRHACIRDVA